LAEEGRAEYQIACFHRISNSMLQRVALDGHYSEWLEVTSGVPQGSILGPLLFILFINDLSEQVHPPTEIALYDDDLKLYRVITPMMILEVYRTI
jgi:hypothetical protein